VHDYPLLAAFLSYRAIRVRHRDAVSDRLFGSLGDPATSGNLNGAG
jgi:hypothetical protein